MFCRSIVLVAILLAACGTAPKTTDQLLPSELSGGWKRGALQSPASSIPDLVSQLGLAFSAETQYEGPAGTVPVRVFVMRAETSAFELMQKWRQSEGTGAYKSRYFFSADPGRSS